MLQVVKGCRADSRAHILEAGDKAPYLPDHPLSPDAKDCRYRSSAIMICLSAIALGHLLCTGASVCCMSKNPVDSSAQQRVSAAPSAANFYKKTWSIDPNYLLEIG